MPLIAGIAFSGLKPNSPIFTTLLSTSDPTFVHSSSSVLGSNLSETIKSLSTSFPEKPASIKLALPSYLDRDARRPILKAFKQASLVFPSLSETLQLGHASLTTKDHTPRNEILFHLAPTLAICRLVSTSVEDGIRESTTLKETTTDSPPSDSNAIITPFVDLAHATLDEQQQLDRIIAITSTEATLSTWIHQGTPIELAKIGFSSIALHAARSALSSYQSALEHPSLYNIAIARIGVVRADGAVHDLVPKHAVFPLTRAATFTTARDGLTTATVSLVVGESARGEENLCLAQVVLRDLGPARQVIRVTVEVDVEGDITLTAQEPESGVSEKIVVKKFIGEHHWDELEEVLEKFKLDPRDAEKEIGEDLKLPE